jgi:bifunctional non-homologous end joining protein LigD
VPKRSPDQLLQKVFPPMLATLVDGLPPDEQNWIYELKYDGFRGLAGLSGGDVALRSRNELDLAPRFPQIAAALRRIKVGEAVLDGEVVALDQQGAPRFQLLQQGDRSEVMFVFDLLWLEGKDLRQLPYESRRELLEKLLRKPPPEIRLAQQIAPPVEQALQKADSEGWEGLIGKLRGSTYEPRRSKAWIKIKAVNEQELAIVGYNPSTASDRDIGSLLLGIVGDDGELQFAGKVGTGFSSKLRAELKRQLDQDRVPVPSVKGAPRMRDVVWTKPRLVAQVHFAEWTSDGRLRHPSFLGLRPDKKPMECVREKPAGNEGRGPGAEGQGSDIVTSSKNAKTASSAKGGKSTKRTGSATSKSATSSKRPKSAASLSPRPSALSPASKGVGRLDPPTLILTSPDRLLYPRDGYTKQDLADYYDAMAEPMIRSLADRPLSLEHWNQGIGRPSWFHQNLSNEVEPWMTTIETPARTKESSVRHFVADSRQALRWLAQRSVLTIHMWHARGANLEMADWIVFDLDPAKGKGIEQAIDAALVMRRLLEQLELPSVPKTSGKRGIHVFVPLAPGYTHEQAGDFACSIAAAVASQFPDMTVERSLVKRRGRLYLDCMQNAYGKTIVAPYSPRGIDGAPVSAPLKWSEVTKKLDPLKFTIKTMPKRFQKVGDLFEPALTGGVELPELK